jgi:hypothetical protein
MLSVANVCGAGFFDDFNRSDGDVGNGWATQTDGTITVQIVDNEVLIAGTQATDWVRCGISRPVVDESMVSCDFMMPGGFNFHIRVDDADTDAYFEVYTWGGNLDHANSEDGGWPGWVAIPDASPIADVYNNIMLELISNEITVTLNDTVVGTFTNANLTNIGSVLISSDAAADTTGSLIIDNVRFGPPPAVHPAIGEPLVIDCLRGTPDAIDGDLSDWNLKAMTPAVLDVAEQLFSGQDSWTGPEDCSGEFYVLWDDVNIYMAVVVKDEKLSMNKTGGSIWNADAVEIFFATTNAVAGHAEHYQYGFNANNQRWNWCNMDGAGSTEPDYLQIASSLTADGYICEASIPYAQMPSLDFSAGNAIGFHPVLDDTDNGDRELQMTWTGREAHDQSLGYGHMILLAPVTPVDPGADGLAAYYALENDVLDGSGNGNDGTIVGNPTWIAGAEGTALEFHGLGAPGGGGDYIDCGSDASLDIPGPISLALWIRPDADDPEGQGTTTAPMAKAMSGIGWSWQVRYGWNSPQPYMAFTFNTSPRAWAYVGQNLAQGEWCHIACSHDGETLKCYLDGEQTDSTPMGQIAGSDAPVLIGSDGWGCDWIGGIDEVAIYDRDLSDGEILYLAGFRENLVLNPSFEDDEAILDDPDWLQWATWNPAEGAGSNATIVDTESIEGARSLRIEPKGIENWHFIVLYLPIMVDMDKNYDVNFWAKAEEPRPLTVQIKATDNSINAWGATDFELTTEWAEYSYTSDVLIDNVKLEILCSGTEVPFWLDLVSVCEGH